MFCLGLLCCQARYVTCLALLVVHSSTADYAVWSVVCAFVVRFGVCFVARLGLEIAAVPATQAFAALSARLPEGASLSTGFDPKRKRQPEALFSLARSFVR